MITFKKGNLLDADVEALVNTVNTVGVMGKGVALQFRKEYHENYKLYQQAAKKGELHMGQMFTTRTNRINGVKYIINFPTKAHWKEKSRIEYIKKGLEDLIKVIVQNNIKSIALPPLGCGNGGLNWNDVKKEIETALGKLPVDVIVFQPNREIMELLKKQEQRVDVKLTNARAMLLYLLYYYRGLGEFASEFAAQKLLYFLQRFGEQQLKLNFKKHYYGPYSSQISHLLYAMDGVYLTGLSQRENKPFDSIELVVDRFDEVNTFIQNQLTPEEKNRLTKVTKLITGFQSPLGLELLSTVDFIVLEKNVQDLSSVVHEVNAWSERKRTIFKDYHIEKALARLRSVDSQYNHLAN